MIVAWRKFGKILGNNLRGIEGFVPHKILRKTPVPEY